MMTLKDKVCIITGAGSGIGKATAIMCRDIGALLCLTDIDERCLDETIKCCRGNGNQNNVVRVVGDLTDPKVRQCIVDDCLKKWSRIDVLINNCATIGKWNCNLMQTKMEELDRVMNLNVKSVVALTQLCVPHLIKTKGCIVNVSSASAKCCVGMLPYSLSKAALDQFTKCAAIELAEHGVRVNSVSPGHVAGTKIDETAQGCCRSTECREERPCGTKEKELRPRECEEEIKKHHAIIGKQYPMGRVGTVEEVANNIVFLASECCSWTTGEIHKVDGGLQRTCCLRI